MEINLDRDRVAELHLQLIDEQDRGRRASIHLELASLSLRDGNLEQATRHFREALWFDDTLDRARIGLRELGDRTKTQPQPRGGLFRTFLNRLKRKSTG